MRAHRPQPVDEVFFDCDSTLSTIEGIDALARLKGAEQRIAELTEAAMNGRVPLQAVYAERLRLLAPTRADLKAIEEAYRRHVVPDAREVIAALHALGRRVFIVSGGLADAVIGFGVWLGVPRERIFAVGLTYNQLSGRWWDYQQYAEHNNPDECYLMYEESPLTTQHGKAEVIPKLRTPGARAMLVGDGASDLAAAHVVDVFVGFGGVVVRPIVAANAPYFLTTPSLAPILLLALADGEGEDLPVKQRARRMLEENPDALRMHSGTCCGHV
ncbi:MAG: HAD-IB family phosphatase [Thermoflexales bacterium]|nr:HAD-IB family phosphatase [Thermoflexales bacterium]MCS7325169.1 HAD-IB family phosphatase [Thermoflexales bacterium]MCX7938251.1 HAD-IB family phosphatase [Thermoflexales bacterium]MDW8053404.1 HAD-IB family phosphatase [Anaerolineae bacterium]MDW8292058.1 HAD-IB family phosphatase [Anaerolineae bacterium]